MLIGHTDTVFPPGTFEGFRKDGDTGFGPGVFDMKTMKATRTGFTIEYTEPLSDATVEELESLALPIARWRTERAEVVERGRYLANHVSLCGDCHTPRGGLQQKADLDRPFAGDASSPFHL